MKARTVEASRSPQLVDRNGAATILDLSTRTIVRLEEAGKLRPLRFGRAVRYRVRDVERLIARVARR